jgi:hypothetical protein
LATIALNASSLSPELMLLLGENEGIRPGSQPSYQLCKSIYLAHPWGSKIVDKPIQMAQSQPREITIPAAPEMVKAAYLREWNRTAYGKSIRNLARTARIYGIGSLGTMIVGEDPAKPLDLMSLWKKEISFNTFDPLNTAGSLVLNQDPLAIDFQHPVAIRVGGKAFHRTRSCIMMNEAPIYIDYQASTFGFTGRSVYQRALYPLKTFIQTMRTDDLIAVKAGVIVAKQEQPGSIIDSAMQYLYAAKRNLLGEAKTSDVLGIGLNEAIETLNFQNLQGPYELARKNCMENVASAVPMPAKLLNDETFAEGFGEGSEDAKAIARFIDGLREDLDPAYKYMETICFHRAVNPELYKLVQKFHPEEYGSRPFEEVFYEWRNSFHATWPNYLSEPPSELVKVDDVKLRALMALLEILLGQLSPTNKAKLVEFVQDNVNEMKILFGGRDLDLDLEDIVTYKPEPAAGDEFKPEPETLARSDSMEEFKAAVLRYVESRPRPVEHRKSA